jgi:hypothetical protein
MKPHPEMIEGPEAWERFKRGMKALMAVPRSEVLPREQELREQIAKNPNRPGPKTKRSKP